MTVTRLLADDEPGTLALAAGLESHSEHPIAQAIVGAAREAGVSPVPVRGAQAVPGLGITAALDGLNAQGSSSVIVGLDTRVVGVMGVADTLRPGIAQAIADLRGAGVAHPVMLTGDRQQVAQSVAHDIGLTEYRAELLPEDKLRIIGELPGPVAMVGAGVNDAPALARADLGIAVASGTDVAIESADVVLMQNDLGRLAGAIRLARDARRTVILNLSFAFGVILTVAPLAVAGQIPLPLGVIAHEGGTVFVVFMGLRLLRHRL
jgi:Cd2+/Zn2+-exporting ATPase